MVNVIPDEVAVSLHFKRYREKPEVVVDFRTKEEHPANALDTKILIYEDRVKGWFFAYGGLLKQHHDAGFVVLQVALAQIEGIEQYRTGASSEGKSGQFFRAGLKRIFALSSSDDAWLKSFYSLVRCGLFHDGMTRHTVWIENRFPNALVYEAPNIKVSPNKFLEAVVADFESYISDLKTQTNTSLREAFEKKWDGKD